MANLFCQDCDSLLLYSDDDVDISMGGMDVPCGEDLDELACRICRRLVCAICAVVEGGLGRECLSCKTTQIGKSRRETWVGGIGWVP